LREGKRRHGGIVLMWDLKESTRRFDSTSSKRGRVAIGDKQCGGGFVFFNKR
jgi:hypothetical protein